MSDRNDFEATVRDFEQTWRQGRPAQIRMFFERGGDTASQFRLLIELICVDVEFRWHAAAMSGDDRWLIEDYVAEFPELGGLDAIPLELVAEEYRARSRWGERPELIEYDQRFSTRCDEITRLLERVDHELRMESSDCGRSDEMVHAPRRSAADYDLESTLRYGDFMLEKMVGMGRTGRVYRARRRDTGELIAVKYLRKRFLHDGRAMQRFAREAGVVGGLAHVGIVDIFGLGATPAGGLFIAMQFVDGPDLSRVIERGIVTIADAVRWSHDACLAVGHAHQRDVLHCDLKPGNLLLGHDGKVRVTDFGLSRSIADADQPLDCIAGTAPFMAPEQISAWWGHMSQRTDVYGIGAVLYAMLTGRAPHVAATLADTLARVVSGVEITPPGELRPDVPAAVEAVCLRCLAKSPHDRYDDMRQLASALGNCGP